MRVHESGFHILERDKFFMRTFGSILIGFVLSLAESALAREDTTACYSITDHDRRNACLSESKKDKSGCVSIIDHDKRAMCQAKVSGNKSDCASIRNSNDRNACQAGMGW
jgi:hypothetical protein